MSVRYNRREDRKGEVRAGDYGVSSKNGSMLANKVSDKHKCISNN